MHNECKEIKISKESLECPPFPFICFEEREGREREKNSNSSNHIKCFFKKKTNFHHGKKGSTHLSTSKSTVLIYEHTLVQID